MPQPPSRSCTAASRCVVRDAHVLRDGNGASPLSVCQRHHASQCQRLCTAIARNQEYWPVLRKCQPVRWSADIGVGSLAHRAGSAVACGSAWQPALFVAPVTHPRYGHRLRRPSGLHNAPIQNMQDSHSAKAPFGALHIPNKALCKVAYAGNCRVPAPWH